MDYEQMTVAQLDAEIQKRTAQRAALKEEALVITFLRDRKVAEEEAAALAASLSDSQKAALLQAIQGAGAIESQEKVKGLK